MCINTEEWKSIRSFHSNKSRRSTRHKVQVYGLMRCERKFERAIKLKNLKLYLENCSIIEENQKLRLKANHLYRENLALKYELHSASDTFSVADKGNKKQLFVKI